MIETTELLRIIDEQQTAGAFGAAGADVAKARGDLVFSAGDKGRFMYIVRKGAIDIEYKGALLESVGPGGLVGEMALIDKDARRSATVVARRDSVLVPVNQRRFRDLVQRNPDFALEVMAVLVRRIREMNDRVATSRSHDV